MGGCPLVPDVVLCQRKERKEPSFYIDGNALVEYDCDDESAVAVIPEGVEEIASDAFKYCQFRTVRLPESLKVIRHGAFWYCNRLRSLTIPKNVDTIEECAVSMCGGLKKVIIENGVKHIKEKAFVWCDSLEDIFIPESVETIGINAIAGFSSIEVSADNKYYASLDGVLFSKDMKTLLQFPENKTCRCYTIPEAVTTIGEWAFLNNLFLDSVIIRDNTELKSFSFGSNNLDKVTIKGTKTTVTISEHEKDIPDEIFSFIGEKNTDKKEDIVFSVRLLKYKIPLIMYMISEYENEKAREYIRKNLRKAMNILIDNNDAESVTNILSFGYVTKRTIDRYIKYAIDTKKTEIQVILSNYKNDNFGFNNSLEKLML